MTRYYQLRELQYMVEQNSSANNSIRYIGVQTNRWKVCVDANKSSDLGTKVLSKLTKILSDFTLVPTIHSIIKVC